MSEDKGFPLPDPVDGYPLICVTLKIPDVLQYRQDFLGHIWQLGKWWVWEQSGVAGDTRAKQAGEYWRQLLYEHLRIGDCPVDCCEDILAAIAALQTQANDQAALNLTNQVTQQQIESQRLRDVLEDRYDGTPTSINPNAPTTNFGATGDRYDALCAGLTAFVYQFARSQADSVRAGQVGGLIAVALVAALLIPGLNFFFLVGASLAVVLGLGTIGVSTETAIAALTDQDALGNVICCMRDNLKALTVTEANWLTALGGCSFDVGSHEQIVADFLGATLADNYLTILNILGQAYTGVVDGVALPECPCEEPIDLWEIVACGYGTVTKNSGPTSGPGTYSFTFNSAFYAGGSVNLGDFRWGNTAQQFVVNSISPSPAPGAGVGTGYHRDPGNAATCAAQAGLIEGLPIANSTTLYGGLAMTTFEPYPWEIVMNITVSEI